MLSYTGPGYFFVPRNIMCSKKWAKPDLPGSTSSRLPVRTTVKYAANPGTGHGNDNRFKAVGQCFLLVRIWEKPIPPAAACASAAGNRQKNVNKYRIMSLENSRFIE